MIPNIKEPRISKSLESDLDYEKRVFHRSLGGNQPQAYYPVTLSKILTYLVWGLVFGLIIFKFVLPADFARSWWLVVYLVLAILIIIVSSITKFIGWLRWLQTLGGDAKVYRSLTIRQYKRYLRLLGYAVIGTIVVVLIILVIVAKYQVKS